MNWGINVLLKTSRLVPAYGLFHSFKGIKCFDFSTLKCGKIVSSSGWLVGGCCFSRQSDKETLLQSTDGNRVNRSNGETATYQISNLDQNVTGAVKMKRSFEAISNNVDIAAEENVDIVTLPQIKKTKIRNAIDPSLECKSIEQSVSKIVNDSSSLVSAEPQKKREDERPKKQRPNYFVAIQISNDQIHQSLKEVQDHILMQEEKLKKSMISLKTLHITLMVMYIGDLETYARAMKALKNVHLEHDDSMSSNPLELEFKGLGHFQNRVLFAKPIVNDTSQRMCSLVESVKKHFAAESIFSTDTREHFTPHLTVAKIDFNNRHKQVKKINPFLYEEFTNQYFGSQKVESIQLLKMVGPKDEAGYYSGDTIYFSAFEPIEQITSLNKLLSIEEQKKDIKDVINKLMKEKLK